MVRQKYTRKNVRQVLVALLLCITLLPLGAFAETETPQENEPSPNTVQSPDEEQTGRDVSGENGENTEQGQTENGDDFGQNENGGDDHHR